MAFVDVEQITLSLPRASKLYMKLFIIYVLIFRGTQQKVLKLMEIQFQIVRNYIKCTTVGPDDNKLGMESTALVTELSPFILTDDKKRKKDKLN